MRPAGSCLGGGEVRLPPSWADTAEHCLGLDGGGVGGDSHSSLDGTSSSLARDGVGMLVLCLGPGGGTLTAGIFAALPLIPAGGSLVCGGTGGALGGAHGV